MLIETFEHQVKKTPDKIAVKSGNRVLTYEELNQYANRIALLLEEENKATQSFEHVGLLLDHGVDMIAAILGTLKAGKTYVPLSPTYPPNRLAYILNHSEASVLVTQPSCLELARVAAQENTTTILNIEKSEESRFVSHEAINPIRQINGEKRAYIMYTSGSTGKPKGVMQNHRNVLYYIRNWTNRFSITEADRMTLFSSFCHDGSVQDMFSALLTGATLYPFDVRMRDDSLKLAQFLLEEKITIWHSVPSLYNFFVNTLKGDEHFEHLRWILLGGEPFRGYEIDQFKTHFRHSTLANVYGQTESSVSTIWTIRPEDTIRRFVIGTPLDNTQIFVINEEGTPVEPLEEGEILIACPHISPGYWNDEELTGSLFDTHPEYGRIYWTGDMGRLLPDGNIEFMGRKDFQVKIRGFRVEPGEIETTLLQIDGIKEAVVTAKNTELGNIYLYAYLTASKELNVSELRRFLSENLPDYMIPTYFAQLEKMPLTQSGKIDRKALSSMKIDPLTSPTVHVTPQTDMEKIIARAWEEVLNLKDVGVHDNLFELGGNSFDIIKINSKLSELLQKNIPVVKLFEHPTIADFSRFLTNTETEHADGQDAQNRKDILEAKIGRKKVALNTEIAIIGMSGRFPGAKNLEEFWENLKNGVESITFFTDDEVLEYGASPEMLKNPDFVKAKGMMEDIEYFDAAFFNYTPKEATIMDPQIRIFHECAWEAFEDAGYFPETYPGAIGVYAGSAASAQWAFRSYADRTSPIGDFEKGFFNNHLSTFISYKFDLRGPSVFLRTACSTSLVAVQNAIGGLKLYECDMALAGGASIALPKKGGYMYQEDSLLSVDGHCRAFDAQATGTVFGDGVGCVILKRLEDALADGDHIYAVIKGSAINNDGIRKVGYTAPSVTGQRDVIQSALWMADVEPESIGYIETHGTGTTLGDPIEIEGLKLAFHTDKKKFCALGSVKTNVGHLNIAAGGAGLIKTVLALKHRLIPPSLNFQTPNPNIDFENSPFYVNTQLKEWRSDGFPLRAGISSFGIGGTNVHIILEEAPQLPPSLPGKPMQLLVLSAKNMSSLDRMTANLAGFLKQHPEINLADAAYTLQVGRKPLEHKRIIVCSNHSSSAVEQIEKNENLSTVFTKQKNKPVVFMFSGQGSQYVNMGLELYQQEPVFREHMDRCFDILNKQSGYDIKAMLYPGESEFGLSMDEAKTKIDDVRYSGPIKFSIESALTKWVMQQWGMKPYAMIGHSFGEYAAAYVSGVFSLEDALKLVVLRGQLMEKTLPGVMMSVPLSAEELKPLLPQNISLAAINTPSLCIVSGPTTAIETFERELNEQGHECLRINFPRASHSNMMAPILDEFEAQARTMTWNHPQIPYIAGLTGDWVTNDDAMNPRYWARHMAETIQFSPGIKKILEKPDVVFLQVGCDRGLPLFVTKHREGKDGNAKINLLRNPKETVSDSYFLLHAIGLLWLHGVTIDWSAYYANERRNRISLPGYVFDRKYYWIEDETFEGFNIKERKKSTQPNRSVSDQAGSLPSTANDPDLMVSNLLTTNENERRVLAIWQDLLGYENIGLNDNFFDLGGDSLAAIEVKKRIRDEFNLQIPVVKILHYPTIHSFVENVLNVENGLNVLEAEKSVEAPEESGNETQEETAEEQQELIDILDKF
ncbi:MAG: amino acid adenylation domain-containing protein [Candidatus Omnitrophota bacterium]